MHLYTDIIFPKISKTFNKNFAKKAFCSSPKFYKNEEYRNVFKCLSNFENLNLFYLHPKHNRLWTHKNSFSEQIIIDSIRKAQSELDRGSLYSLQESVNIYYKYLNEEKKVKFQKAIDELNVLLIAKSNLRKEKIQILTENNSKGYKDKEILGLFITGFFFAIASVTHSLFYLVSVYGLYILHKASKENNNMIYVEQKLNENKNKLLINKKSIQTILTTLEHDLTKIK
ncbi:hypothetical protein PGO_062170 [Plasmodium gonderi]|uniref:Uncharacterized protein n=1 Tax=Plasmodium gonderi TaxID=77519 RepID=A0A1Y1JH39_PLAGO|nr:hypothetical protein PGO_062170 [Plasmodium gonderi]GAW80072.1 hypothetical protein PGO_062170 [Plasmodium gonderi]